jgi:hypothetical protein
MKEELPIGGYPHVWREVWKTRFEVCARLAHHQVYWSFPELIPAGKPASSSSWVYWLAALCGVTNDQD